MNNKVKTAVNNKVKRVLERIIHFAKAGKLGASTPYNNSCVYADGHGKYCAIGCLFTGGALYILHRDDNLNADISHLYSEYPHLQNALGLTLAQAEALQTRHDFTNFNEQQDRDIYIQELQHLLKSSGRYLGAQF